MTKGIGHDVKYILGFCSDPKDHFKPNASPCMWANGGAKAILDLCKLGNTSR